MAKRIADRVPRASSRGKGPRRKSKGPHRKSKGGRSKPTHAQPAVSGLAPGMQSVNSYLAVANVAATMEFLERAFGFTRGVVLPDSGGSIGAPRI